MDQNISLRNDIDTHTCSCEYPTTTRLHSLLLPSLSKRACLVPLSRDAVFLSHFLGNFLITRWHIENKLWGLQIACPCHLTQGFTHSKALFWKGEEAPKHWNGEGNVYRRTGFFSMPRSTASGSFSSSLTLTALLTSKHTVWFRACSSLLCYSERKEILIFKLICAAAPSFALAALSTEHGCSGTSRWNIPFALC